MAEEEDPWRERGRAVLLGLILALGVVAMVLLGRRSGGRSATATEWPSVAGIYEVIAACEGCGCEPSATEGELAAVHPGAPIGRPAPRSCPSPAACVAMLERRTPPAVRGPVVLAPGAEPELVRRELAHGPLLTAAGEGFEAVVERERRSEAECVVVRRTSRLEPVGDGDWRWVERYESAAGADCPSAEALGCRAETRRTLRPASR